MSGACQDEENEEVHQDEPHRPPSPPPQENNNTNNEEGQEEEQDDEEDVPPRPKQNLSRVIARVSRDHPVEQMFNDIQSGRITSSKTCLSTFSEHYSFISII